eukprot:gene4082-14182_t
MVGLFSKKSSAKVAPAPEKPNSAPSRLEGGFEVAPVDVVARRAITPQQDSTGTSPVADSQAGTPKKGKKIDVIGKQTDGAQLAAALPAAAKQPLSEEGKAWAQVFPERVIQNLFSGNWKDREEGLSAIGRILNDSKFTSCHDASQTYTVSVQITSRSLKDKISPIFHASLQLLLIIISAYGLKLPAATLRPVMDVVLATLIHRCGNLNTRIHESSLDAIVSIAGYPNFGVAYVSPFALAPVPKVAKDANASAQMYGRLVLLSAMLSTLSTGKPNEGLGLQETLSFAKQGLEMPDEKVRQAAIKVCVDMYRLRRSIGADLEIEKYLGPVKPALLQVLQRKFAEASVEVGVSVGGERSALATGVSIKVRGAPVPSTSFNRQGLPPIGTPSKLSRPGTGASVLSDMDGGLGVTGRPVSISRAPSNLSPMPSMRRNDSKGGFGRVNSGIEGIPAPSRMATPKTPNTPSRMASMGPSSPLKNRSFKSSMQDVPQSPVLVLDDAEEQLIQYIGGDDKTTAPAGIRAS